MALRSSGAKYGQVWGFGFGSSGGGATFGAGLGRLARQASAPSPSGRGRGLGRTGSGAGWGAGLGALQPQKMLYVGPCPSLGHGMPRILLAWVCRLAVRILIILSSSVGLDIQRCVCVIPYLRM